jgi:hypothetical protein
MYFFACVGFKNHQENIRVPYAKVLLTLKVAGGIPQNGDTLPRSSHALSCSSFTVARLCMLLLLPS